MNSSESWTVLVLLICLSTLLWSGGTAWAGVEFPILVTSQPEVTPSISGDLLVSAQSAPWGYRIWGRDLTTGLDFPVTSTPINSWGPDIADGVMVWVGLPVNIPPEPWSICAKSLLTGDESLICAANGERFGPVASSEFVAWTDLRCRAEAPPDSDYTADVYGYDLLLGVEVPVAVASGVTEWHPSINGNRMVYTDCGYPGQLRGVLLARDPVSGHLTFEEFPIPQTSSWFRDCPMISGDFVVWMDYWDGDFYHADIMAVDLRTGVPFPVSTVPGSAPQSSTEVGMDISGSIVVWEDWRNNPGHWNEPPFNCDVYGYDLATGVEFPVCTDLGVQTRPRVSGNVVVWEDYRVPFSQGDVYGYRLNVTATPTGTVVSTTVIGTTVVFDSVQEAGMTTVDALAEPPAPSPTGFQLIGNCYSITTTAQTAGEITIERHYRDDGALGALENSMSLLWWDGSQWLDITVRPVDVTNNIVTGQCTALSVVALAVPVQSFSDVAPDYWAFGEIEACAESGVVQGYGGGTYQPTWQVTRAQMAVFIARALVAPEGDAGLENWQAPATASFSDVGTSFWCYKHVEYLNAQQVVEGYPDRTYRPTGIVTRDQMAVYVSRAIADPTGEAGLVGYTPPDAPSFDDVPRSHWAYRHIEFAHSRDVVFGYDDGYYRPDNAVTRAQMAVYVARAFDLAI